MNHDLPKECVVMYKPTGELMAYDPKGNYVYRSGNGKYHVFPAKHRARSALSVTIEMEKSKENPRPQDDYEIIET